MSALARIVSDIDAQLDRNPTFMRRLAVFVFHPGFHVVFRARLARRCMRIVPLWPLGKLLWYLNVVLNGCYISPRATIGSGLRLPHATGIVIGDGSVIGRDVAIYQNVTLGRKNARDDAYPAVDDECIIYAGAVVVGGVILGHGSVVGANSVVLESMPDGSVARAPLSEVQSRKMS